MFVISPDSPAFYLTSVTKDRLPVFRSEKMKAVACRALNEARTSGNFLIFAYVIMPDHLHVITDSNKESSVILRFINGIIGRRVIDFLKQQGHFTSLEKLRHEDYRRRHRYSLWDHHPNIRVLTNDPCSCNVYATRIKILFGLDWWKTRKTISIQVRGSGIEGL